MYPLSKTILIVKRDIYLIWYTENALRLQRINLKKEMSSRIAADKHQVNFACETVLNIRGAIIEQALMDGYISYSDDDSRLMLGAYMVV